MKLKTGMKAGAGPQGMNHSTTLVRMTAPKGKPARKPARPTPVPRRRERHS
jgi:hypothetical protein